MDPDASASSDDKGMGKDEGSPRSPSPLCFLRSLVESGAFLWDSFFCFSAVPGLKRLTETKNNDTLINVLSIPARKKRRKVRR